MTVHRFRNPHAPLDCPSWCEQGPRHTYEIADPTVDGDYLHEGPIGSAGDVQVILSQIGRSAPGVLLVTEECPVLDTTQAEALVELLTQAVTILEHTRTTPPNAAGPQTTRLPDGVTRLDDRRH